MTGSRAPALLVLAVLAAAVLAAACAGGGSAPGAGDGRATTELQVYAAASLREALARVRAAYEAAMPGVRLTVSTDSSAALAAKIELGAPADVLLSADVVNPQKLVDAGLAAGGVTPFAGNRLAIVVPRDNPAGIASAADLAAEGVRIIACAEGVPIAGYTAQLLRDLVERAGLPAGFPAAYLANVASEEDHVGAIVAKVGLGEGDAGIVYATDVAAAAATVAAIELPAEANPQVSYGAVVIGRSPDRDAAAAFVAWLAGPAGQAILASSGFLPVH